MLLGFVFLVLFLFPFFLLISLFLDLAFSSSILLFFLCVLFPSLPCGLHPSGWHAGCRPYPSHNISPPAIRGLTALRSPGNCFGCEQNFKHQVPPEFSLPLSLFSFSFSLIHLLVLFLFPSRSVARSLALPDDPRELKWALECLMRRGRLGIAVLYREREKKYSKGRDRKSNQGG